MAMVVQHNITAMNSNRQLGVTTSAQAKSSEKLSSGFKINRAADDAAGLTISEKMRKQMRGLDRAATNAQDGVSAVQTAEGALTEVHSMLQRMNELAVQSANGTNSASDRSAIQAEIDQLTTEIDRVSETTKFNETYLLKGGDSTTSIGAKYKAHAAVTDIVFNKASGTAITKLDDVIKVDPDTNQLSAREKDTLAIGKEYTKANYVVSEAADATVKWKGDDQNKLYALNTTTGDITEITKKNYADFFTSTDTSADVTAKAGYVYAEVNEATGDNDALGKVSSVTASALSFNLHVGADSNSENKINVKIASMDSDTLGVKDVDLSTEEGATNAIDKIATAVSRVSNQRSALGAIQNRLEHTIANLDNVVENTTAAESRIRDTDMAKEMVTYSKNNILQQAGQSMLAQANQATQGVLSLLQ